MKWNTFTNTVALSLLVSMSSTDRLHAEPVTWVTLTSDNFELSLGNFVSGGPNCLHYNGGVFSHQGVGAANVQQGGPSAELTTAHARNISSYNAMQVTFWFRAEGTDNGEYFFLQYFDGHSYLTIAKFESGIDFQNGLFYQVTTTLHKATHAFPVSTRIRFQPAMSDADDDLYIDEVVWRVTSSVLSAAEYPGVTIKRPGVEVGDPELVWSDQAATKRISAELMQNVPNPFNPRTTISFTLTADSNVRLDVFDVTGKHMMTLVDGVRSAGRHAIGMDASSLASGMYFCRLSAGGVVQQRKMILLK